MKQIITLLCIIMLGPVLQAQDKPKIVVIMLDDVSPTGLSIYHRGLGAVNTPNIDHIEKNGIVFIKNYVQPS